MCITMNIKIPTYLERYKEILLMLQTVTLKNIKYYFFSEQWIENKWKVS